MIDGRLWNKAKSKTTRRSRKDGTKGLHPLRPRARAQVMTMYLELKAAQRAR